VIFGGAFVLRQTLLAPLAPRPAPALPTVASTEERSPAGASGDWELSVYFTAVESFYTGPAVELRGCPELDCANGQADLGAFPRDFLAAVKEEGSGRLSSGGPGTYLNWATSTGYWLDTAPRDARGSVLHPYVSAAADPSIDYVTSVTIQDCGRDIQTGQPANPVVCDALRAGRWVVRDRFTAGRVGKHVDLYVGEQPTADFINSPRTIHTVGATITLQAPPLQP